MALDKKRFSYGFDHTLRDTRPFLKRLEHWLENSDHAIMVFITIAAVILIIPQAIYFLDLLLITGGGYFGWLCSRNRELPYKLPKSASQKLKDKNNEGGGRSGKPEGIMYLGNKDKSGEEVWFTDSDCRTHILYLGTTGSGKTEGLKSIATNALCWSSGFVYVDGKADTGLWSSISSLCRRFGRDDDLFVLNYMTGNSDVRAPSNTMNPFSSGSASYLTNMLVSLMPNAEGDNAMWKERAVSLIGSIMPVLTWKRDNQDIPMSVGTIRKYLELGPIIQLSRDEAVPEELRDSLMGYLRTLPGYVDAVFDDDGNEKPAGPDVPMVDTQVVRQQHGYLSMQFTRALQSLADDYGYIFDARAADVDMVDIVLNRRMLVVLIPALEKSSDETANLGKIVAATLKGMMGSTLGASVEGNVAKVIENKPTNSATPFITIFDEVGYYTAEGMAVMAAQARSLGFCLVYAAQDLPALEKRVKEEARSITGNCNIKIFGKLEDPTQTKEFFEKTVGESMVTEVSSFSIGSDSLTGGYQDGKQAGLKSVPNASYGGLKKFKEGQAVVNFGSTVEDVKIFYCNPGNAKAMRVQRFVALAPPNDEELKKVSSLAKLRDRMVSKSWTALKAASNTAVLPEIEAVEEGFLKGMEAGLPLTEASTVAVVETYARINNINPDDIEGESKSGSGGDSKAPAKPSAPASKVPEPAGAPPAPKDPAMQPAKSAGWDALVDDAEDEDEESRSGSGSGDARKMKMVKPDEFSSDAAVEALANNDEYTMPEGLSDDVMEILMGAAEDIRSGLFKGPVLEKAADPVSEEKKPKIIKPKGS